jgi:hypothetical protein
MLPVFKRKSFDFLPVGIRWRKLNEIVKGDKNR